MTFILYDECLSYFSYCLLILESVFKKKKQKPKTKQQKTVQLSILVKLKFWLPRKLFTFTGNLEHKCLLDCSLSESSAARGFFPSLSLIFCSDEGLKRAPLWCWCNMGCYLLFFYCQKYTFRIIWSMPRGKWEKGVPFPIHMLIPVYS